MFRLLAILGSAAAATWAFNSSYTYPTLQPAFIATSLYNISTQYQFTDCPFACSPLNPVEEYSPYACENVLSEVPGIFYCGGSTTVIFEDETLTNTETATATVSATATVGPSPSPSLPRFQHGTRNLMVGLGIASAIYATYIFNVRYRAVPLKQVRHEEEVGDPQKVD